MLHGRGTAGVRAIRAWLHHASTSGRYVGMVLPMAFALSACSTRSAPAVVAFGAYFPNWLVIAILALVFAIVARVVVGMAGLSQQVPYLLFTCLSIGILVAGAIDLLWLDR